jgi:excisionase family DNA binding protein
MNSATLIAVNDEWLSVRDVALRLSKSEPTVRRAIRLGALTAYTFGERGYSVAPSDLQSFISKRRKGGDAAGDVAGSNQDRLA